MKSPWYEYLNKLDKEKRDIVVTILAIAKKHTLEPEETMSYGVPTLKSNSNYIIAVAPHKNHVGVYPFGEAPIIAVKHMLGDVKTSKGTICFPYNALPTEEQLAAIVAFNLNR